MNEEKNKNEEAIFYHTEFLHNYLNKKIMI